MGLSRVFTHILGYIIFPLEARSTAQELFIISFILNMSLCLLGKSTFLS